MNNNELNKEVVSVSTRKVNLEEDNSYNIRSSIRIDDIDGLRDSICKLENMIYGLDIKHDSLVELTNKNHECIKAVEIKADQNRNDINIDRANIDIINDTIQKMLEIENGICRRIHNLKLVSVVLSCILAITDTILLVGLLL